MTVYPLQANMTRGELTPYAHARGDTEHYAAALGLARGVCVTRYGGVTRTPGTFYHGGAKFNNKLSRHIPFVFNRSQVYAIEAGDLYFRFWTDGGRIENPPGTPVEVVTPYAEADLKWLRVRQSGDVIYIWCRKTAGGAYQPRMLKRNSETSWTLSLYEPKDGPFLKEDTQGTTMTPAARGSITPIMTNNTTPSGTAASNGGSANAYRVFDGDKGVAFVQSGRTGWVSYDLPGANTAVADAYWVGSDSANPQDVPISWTFEGFDGTNWIVLDTRSGEPSWAAGETRFYDVVNKIAYQAYRFQWTAITESSSSDSRVGEIGIHESGDTQTAFNLVASSVNGINNNTGFLASDVGRVMRLLGSDGRWRTAVIVSRTNATTVTIRLYGHALPNTNAIARWQMGAFSEFSGWPGAGAIYEDRLVHARTDADPLGMWLSVNGDYQNFRLSSPVVADDGVSVRLTGGGLDEISWLEESISKDILAGTAGSLRAVGRNNEGEAFGPSNVRQRAQTLSPSSTADPVAIENVLLFLDFYEQRLYEAAYTYEVDGYLAREASTLNEHLFAAGVAQIAYLSHPHKMVIGRRYDGKLIFFTYDREQKVAGGTLVDFGGVVESILDLPGTTATDLWMVIRRTINGSTVRYVERLSEFWRADYTVQDIPLYGACGGIRDGAPATTISGVAHLNGETVGVWADGRDIGDAEVSGGSFTLPGGVSAEQIAWGIRMPWNVRTLRLTQIGNQDGSGLGRSVNIVSAYIDILETAGINVGSLLTQDLLTFEDEIEEDPDEPKPLRSGMFQIAVDDTWSNNGVLDINGDKMYPVTIRGIQLNIDGEP